MERATSWLAASTLAISGMVFIPQAFAADTNTSDNNGATVTKTEQTTVQSNDNNNNGNNANVAAPDADDIREAVAKVANNAFADQGGYKDVIDYFVDADRNRLSNFKAPDTKLDGRVAEFQKDWKAKYNEDFNLNDHRKDALNDQFARIVQGEIGEAQTAGGKEMPSATPQNVKGGTPQELQKSGVNQPDANSNKHYGGDTNREPGRNIATFLIEGNAKASAGINPDNGSNPVHADMQVNKQLAVPMIHEAGGWKIDAPDDLTGQQLYDNLLNQLTKFDENKANWPADKDQAYREATRQVMEAIMQKGA